MSTIYESNPPTLAPSVVCFWDILGYSQLLSSLPPEDLAEQNRQLNLLNDAVVTAYESYKTDKEWKDELSVAKIFTDNVVLATRLDILDNNEYGMGLTIPRIVFTQLHLAYQGYFIRGGISVGYFYMDEQLVFGPALLKSVQLEKEAIYPRVILDASAVDEITKYAHYYSDPENNPASSQLLVDEEGVTFINYLDFAIDVDKEEIYDFWESDWGKPGAVHFRYVMKHKESIIKQLKIVRQGSEGERIQAKYRWSAEYHNNVIRIFNLDEELKIPGYRDDGMRRFLL